jgi:hypothetical protein
MVIQWDWLQKGQDGPIESNAALVNKKAAFQASPRLGN